MNDENTLKVGGVEEVTVVPVEAPVTSAPEAPVEVVEATVEQAPEVPTEVATATDAEVVGEVPSQTIA